ncbi:MAG: TetR/AcrR family transcriptional regulator [Clostridiales bacterium]|nr:TetR/AcrR family transcriptional regulator [Clostridiales bacterium]
MIDKKVEIFRCGRALFAKKGYKDTNVAEIMKAAGFATGSFYRYYPSKDHLFMDIYNQENVALKKRIMQDVDIDAEPMLVMQELMGKNLAGMKENPILREWYNRDTFYKIERSFRETNAIENVDFVYDIYIEAVRYWQEKGRMRDDIGAEMIMAIFSALINIDFHKEEIGVRYFPEVMEHLGVFIMQGLAPQREPGNAQRA